MKIIYSFNKRGFEADYWSREIPAASGEGVTFIPFNHDPYLPPQLYVRAQLLDELWYARDRRLLRMYGDLEALIRDTGADALIADNYFPYHPEFLRTLPVYKVLRTTDGPVTAYDRDFAYVHAYDHALYHTRAYSRDLGMREKLLYVGAKRVDHWPLALFDAVFDPAIDEETLFAGERDVDVVFVGALHRSKLAMLAKISKALGRSLQQYGLASWKMNLYWNVKYGFPGVIRRIPFERIPALYRRSKIGFNVHNRGKYTVGNYRMFELAASGVMQISDGGEYLGDFYDVGREIVGYESADELIDKIRYYLREHDQRNAIARAAYRRVMRDHRIGKRLREAAALIENGMRRTPATDHELSSTTR